MQYKKLFKKSEIEYITPFLKLWMSFNSWYKKDLESQKIPIFDKDGNIKKNDDWTDKEKNIKTDAEAINYYKKYWKIKEEFLKLFDESSDLWIDFNISIFELVLNIKNYTLEYSNWDPVCYQENLIYENIDWRSWLNPIYVSEIKGRFQIPWDKKEELFSQSLEVIYQVRSNLVHWSFDIENEYFLKLVEASYKILYPIIDRIFANEEAIARTNEYFNKNYFEELSNKIDELIISNINPIRKITELYITSIDYDSSISWIEFWILANNIYKNIFWKSLKELKEEKGVDIKQNLFNFFSDDEKEKINVWVTKILLFAKKQVEKQIPMKMDDWKKEIENILKNK